MRIALTGLMTSIVLAAALAPSGCGWLFSDRAPSSASAPPISMFVDIPLPPEAELNQKDSQVYEHAIGRVGLMRASVRLSQDAVLSYYREAMVQRGWSRESEFDNGDRKLMIFSKSPRSAAITVSEGWMKTDVEINVSARQQ
ncbi:hypothetical protein LJB99_01170 [Deltaproteobacteria bacterium OttesenSCG-928-K17]|nr:hypothetical protein [Deltaproteobacteria bacterium OttesenSCG-928-K17]